nr:GDSL family lipase [Desulfobulbaceae bacterium]
MTTLHFIGDSLIEYFDWQYRFSTCKVINSGCAGETVSELCRRTDSLIRLSPQPDWVIIMIGTNNLAMQDFSFMPDYEKIIDTFQTHTPSSKILVHGLFPFKLPGLAENAIPSVNTMIKTLAKNKRLKYLDGCCIFTKYNKNVRYFLEDGVHISDHGYSIWSDAIAELIL